MESPIAVILAAGQSKRMKSDVPKVLHEICGRPMIEYVLDAAREAGANRLVVIVGHRADLVKEKLSHHADVEFALQTEQLGTGHAVMMAEESLSGHEGPVLILAGDTPLLGSGSLAALLEEQQRREAACVIGTAVTEANEGLGRIVRDADREFQKIVEQKDATPEEAAIQEINTGCFAFDGGALLESLKKIRPDNAQAEYYLTDCPAILKAEGKRVVAASKLDIVEAMGVNTRVQMADVQKILVQDHLQKLMLEGVTVVAPEQTYVEPQVTIEADTVVYPFCSISGLVRIGRNCRIGPHAVIQGDMKIEDGQKVGPFESVVK